MCFVGYLWLDMQRDDPKSLGEGGDCLCVFLCVLTYLCLDRGTSGSFGIVSTCSNTSNTCSTSASM